MPEEPQPAPQPQVTTTPKSINWKKIGLTVLIILVVTGLIAAVYWFFILNKDSEVLSDPIAPQPSTQTATESAKTSSTSAEKDETADWMVYEAENFSFSYPPNWKVEKESGVGITLNSPDFDSDTPSQSVPATVIKKGTTIKFSTPEKYPSGNDLNQYLKDNGYSSYYSSGVGVLSETTLDGESGLKYDTKLGVYSTSENNTSTSYFVVHKGKIYKITRSYVSGEQSEYQETVSKILETFKFLD